MGRTWVVNSSPLILLAKIGSLPLLQHLPDNLIISPAAADEVRKGPMSDPSRLWLESTGAQYLCPSGPVPSAIAAWDLGAGETGVLTIAGGNASHVAVIDDRAARNCATALGIHEAGTLGVIILAKRAGLVPLVAPLFDRLTTADIRIARDVLDHALRLAGEPPG